MNRKRTSLVWRISDEEFRTVIEQAYSYSHALSYFNLQNKGHNSNTIKDRIKHLGLSTAHFLGRIESSTRSRQLTKERFIQNVLTENSGKQRHCVKKYLLRFDLIKYECSKCFNNGVWMNEKISLQLDHKNGINNDNRLDNLTFLCPNCHSQTDNFAGKACRKNTKNGWGSRVRSDPSTFKELRARQLHHPPKNCKKCGNIFNKVGKKCEACVQKTSPRYKIKWPTPEVVQKLLWEKPCTVIAKEWGISDNAINKFVKKHGLTKPGRGYWAKLAAGKILPAQTT